MSVNEAKIIKKVFAAKGGNPSAADIEAAFLNPSGDGYVISTLRLREWMNEPMRRRWIMTMRRRRVQSIAKGSPYRRSIPLGGDWYRHATKGRIGTYK